MLPLILSIESSCDDTSAAVMQGKLLQGVQTVVGEDEARVALNGIFGLVDHGVGAALVKSCCCKLVAVERFALEREEDASFGTVATVGCDNGVLLENFVKLCYVHCFSVFLFRSFSVSFFLCFCSVYASSVVARFGLTAAKLS